MTLVGPASWAETAGTTSFEIGYSNFVSSGEPYFGQDYNSNSLSTAGLGFDLENKKPGEKSRVDISAFYSFGEDKAYINPSQAYFDYGGPDEELVIGRKKYNWSEADEAWNTGLWQPQFRWNRLRPESQGLVGGFWQKKISKKNEIKLFVSPVFVPDTGVSFEEKDGTLQSKNPWFRPPPPTMELFDEVTDVYARVEIPKASEVLFNPGFGLRIDRQATQKERYGLAYGYKPVNQIMNAFDYQVRSATEGGGAYLTFFPWVVYHHLVTADWKYQDRRYGHLMSYTYEKPTRQFEDPLLNYQTLEESFIVSWMSSWNISGEGDSATKLYGGYMRFWGGSSEDGGDTVSEGTQFELRPRFVSVGKLGLRYPIWTKYRRLYNSFEVNYDAIMEGGTILTQLEYLFQDGWVMGLNVDLIGVFEEQEDLYKNSFVNTYRANDLVKLRMSYVY